MLKKLTAFLTVAVMVTSVEALLPLKQTAVYICRGDFWVRKV